MAKISKINARQKKKITDPRMSEKQKKEKIQGKMHTYTS